MFSEYPHELPHVSHVLNCQQTGRHAMDMAFVWLEPGVGSLRELTEADEKPQGGTQL